MSDRILFEHALLRAVAFQAETPAGPRPFLRLELADWANVVAVTPAGQLVLVRQHRWGIGRETLEIPGGIVDPGETPAEAAVRELREETGYGGGTLVPMGSVWSNPAIQTNRTWLFAVEGAVRVGDPRPDETEALTVELHPLADLGRLLEAGTVDHALAVVSLQRYLLRRRPPGPAR